MSLECPIFILKAKKNLQRQSEIFLAYLLLVVILIFGKIFCMCHGVKHIYIYISSLPSSIHWKGVVATILQVQWAPRSWFLNTINRNQCSSEKWLTPGLEKPEMRLKYLIVPEKQRSSQRQMGTWQSPFSL